MSYPIAVGVTFDFSNGPIFGYPFILDDPKNGVLGKSTLGDTIPQIVDISNQVGSIAIRGGYNLQQDQFQSGTATIRIFDTNGNWNPQNPASEYYPNLVPLRKIRVFATPDATGVTSYLFSGYVTSYAYSYPKDQTLGYLDITASDGFRLFNLANVTTVPSATAGQTTGTRINKILDAVSFPNGMREIDTGDSNVQADPGTARTSLQALKNVEFCEQGAFYMDGEGDAVFKSRHWIQNQTGKNPTIFNQNGTGIPYWNLTFANDDKLVINTANITGIGQATQTAYDNDSIARYFPHSFTQGSLVTETAAQALDIAKVYVATRKDTTIRIDAMTLDLTTPNYTDGINAALNLDYFSTVSISNVQPGGSEINKTLQVMGMAHDITPQNWKTTFTTSEPIVDAFILNSTQYGILGVSVLTY